MKKKILIVIAALAALSAPAAASNGTGTAAFCERHGCSAPAECPKPEPCPTVECPACPTLVCPDVVCNDESGPVVLVAPQECPAAPNYVPCRRRKDGTMKCPRPLTPRRVLAPEGRYPQAK